MRTSSISSARCATLRLRCTSSLSTLSSPLGNVCPAFPSPSSHAHPHAPHASQRCSVEIVRAKGSRASRLATERFEDAGGAQRMIWLVLPFVSSFVSADVDGGSVVDRQFGGFRPVQSHPSVRQGRNRASFICWVRSERYLSGMQDGG